MMCAPWSKRKCDTAATTPGRSRHEISRRPMSSFNPLARYRADAFFEFVGELGSLPWHVQIGPTEVAVGRGLLEDRPAQIEGFDDAGGAEVERFGDGALDLLDRHSLRAVRLHRYRHRSGDADGVRQIHLD